MRPMNRRTFVKHAILAGAAATITPSWLSSAEAAAVPADTLTARLLLQRLSSRMRLDGLDPTADYTIKFQIFGGVGNVVSLNVSQTATVTAAERRVRVGSPDNRLVARLNSRTGSLRATYSLAREPGLDFYLVELTVDGPSGRVGESCAEVGTANPTDESPIVASGGTCQTG